jgi:uncharacterized membrane protein
VNPSTSLEEQDSAHPAPDLNRIAVSDLIACLKAGLRDFAAEPGYGLFFGLFYALGGLLIVGISFLRGYYVTILPLVMGFALIGPFVALGLYEVSRRREKGLPLSFLIVLGAMRRHSSRQIIMLGVALMILLLFWVRVALLIYALNFGLAPVNLLAAGYGVLTTPEGISFMATGMIVGAVFAFVAFAVSVLSFPHLLAREADFISAIVVSLRGVFLNLPVMIVWGALVGVMLVLAALPFFLGMLVVLPIVGHATWHLYRKIVIA